MTRTHVLVDIDHTLSDAFPRDAMIGGEGGWDAYHTASAADEPIHDLVVAINAFHAAGLSVIGLTARPAKWRTLTQAWLVKHGILMADILMREDTDYRPAPAIKLALACERFGGEEEVRSQVAFILDDREDVVTAFAGLGVTALQVFARRGGR